MIPFGDQIYIYIRETCIVYTNMFKANELLFNEHTYAIITHRDEWDMSGAWDIDGILINVI